MINKEQEEQLKARLYLALEEVGVKNLDKSHIWKEIKKRYEEEHRSYHTLQHIYEGLQTYDKLGQKAENEACFILAWFGHDFVYKLGSRYNELNSAQEFNDLLKKYKADKDEISLIANLIVNTTYIDPSGHYINNAFLEDEKLIRDVDLSGFGMTPEVFEQQNKRVYEELNRGKEDATEFRNKQIAFLEILQKVPELYNTSIYREMYQKQARKNIANQIRKLRAGWNY